MNKNNSSHRQANGIRKKYDKIHQVKRQRAKLRQYPFDSKSMMNLFNADHTIKFLFPESKDTMILFKPNYSIMSDEIFKQMFSRIIIDDQRIVRYVLYTTENLSALRHYTQLLNDFFCLKYENDFWQTYFRISIRAGLWSTTTTKITKEMALENGLDRYLFTTPRNILNRQMFIKIQSNKIQHDLHESQQQLEEKMDELSIDRNLLFRTLTLFVGNQLYQLRTEYEWQKLLFQYDAHDYCLVKSFYTCQPTKDQISSAKLIWHTTVDQFKIEVQLQQTSRYLQTINELNCKNLIIESMKKTKETIDNYKRQIENEMKKLLNNERTIHELTRAAHLVDVIKHRHKNICERTQHLLKHQLMMVASNPV